MSAVPKPDIRGVEDSLQSEVVHEADNDDLKEFKSAVKDCKSAVSVSFSDVIFCLNACSCLCSSKRLR